MANPVLDIRAVSRRFGNRLAVDAASFALHRGRVTCLLGPSGCGKSTLLRMIAGLERIDAGEVAIGGVTVATPAGGIGPEHRGVGLVFQDLALFPHLSVADNVGFGLRHLAVADRRARVITLLDRFHARALADAWPHTLSGGEQQRVAIARAMAREPALLLLDEPFSGLDGHLRAQVRTSVLNDLRAAGATVLIVTHDPEEAMVFADEMILMTDGRILQAGSPEDCYRHPISEASARLMGEVLVVPATVAAGIASTPFGSFPVEGAADGRTRAMIRLEGLRLDPAGVPARVLAVRFAGSMHIVEAALGDCSVAISTLEPPPMHGSAIGIALDRERACLRLLPDPA